MEIYTLTMSQAFVKSFFDEIFALLNPVTFPWSKLVLPMLTLIGAWGGFPDPPQVVKKIAQWKFFQYFFLWILAMQGGASADPGLSFISVILFGIITEILNMFDSSSSTKTTKDVANEKAN